MSFLGQTLQKPLPAPGAHQATERNHRWRWVVLTFLSIILVTGGWWAWVHFNSGGESITRSSAPVVANTTSNSGGDSTMTIQTQPVAQPQPVVEQASMPAPEEQPEAAPVAAAAITTTQSTRTMVVIAGTNGATLLTAPGGEQLGELGIGALLNATGRNEDGAWLYVSSANGETGWVAVNQIVAFGVEKLAVVTVTAPHLAVVAEAEDPTVPESTTLTVTVDSGATTEIAATAVVTLADSTTAIVAESEAEPAATDEPLPTGTTATVMVNGARLNIRSGPGTAYGIVGKANRNETVTVLARNDTSDWVQIALSDSEAGFGWVAVPYLRLNSAIIDLPVSEEVSAAPTLAAAAMPSTVTATSISATQAAETATTQPVVTQSAAVVRAGSAPGLRGTLVFQSSPGGMIYAYDLNTERLRQLTNGFDPAISPDGQTVAFVRTAGENGIYLINSDGSNERLIFSGRNSLAAPKWSPDGNYIVFTRGDEYNECRDLGRGMCMTDRELLNQNPNFPVDNFPLIKQYESNLARVDLHGANYRDLATLESARAADWNEAGIVYQSKAGLQVTADTPDATSQRLIHDPYKPAYEDPDWQPNGGRIVFVSRSGNHREIFAVNPDGSGMVALTRPVTTLVDELPNNVAPAWSPDGQSIVFLSNRGDDNSAGAWKLWVMDADGSNQHPLPIDVAINYTYGNEQLVSWGR